MYNNNDEQYVPVAPVAKGGYVWILIFLWRSEFNSAKICHLLSMILIFIDEMA